MSLSPWSFDEKARDLEKMLAGLCERQGRSFFSLPFFGETHTVSPQGVTDGQGLEAPPAVSMVLLEYLLHGGSDVCGGPAQPDWISYRDCRGAGPLMGYFQENTAKTLVRTFSGRPDDLKAAGKGLGAVILDGDGSFDVSLRFHALPDIPLLLRFCDAEEGFPASCQIFFPRSAQDVLDIRCLGVIGTCLTGRLIRTR